MKNNIKIIFVFLIIVVFILSSCKKPVTPPDQPVVDKTGTLNVQPISLSDTKQLFAKHYNLQGFDIELKTSQYNLPLKTSKIKNYKDFSKKIQLGNEALDLLSKNGFVVIKNPYSPGEEDIIKPYKALKESEIPIFITSDSLLHLYHIQFDETLRIIEEREFYDAIWSIDKKLLEDSINKYNTASGDLKQASKNNVAYFSVALELLKPKDDQIQEKCDEYDWRCLESQTDALFTQQEKEKYTFEIPDFVKDDVDKELELIDAHSGFVDSPIFKYKEDYSQYVPRGHYTRSEKLKNYFKAFMWHGRISMLLKKDLFLPDPNAEYYPKIQTMSASLIASKLKENKEIRDKWNRVYSVTSFYVGLSDDLGPYEYIEAIDSVLGESFDANNLNDETIGKLKAKLAEYSAPKIYGGTGTCEIPPPFTPEQADQCLETTKGFRLMGQRFIPDSYMLSNLVFGKVKAYLGDKECDDVFTCGFIPNFGDGRVFPRGLDVMSLLGSERAKELLDELDDSNYKDYDKQFNKLEKEFDEYNDADWNKNLYWSWLYALKPLLKEFDDGYPSFMQTKAWQDKELTTALASWSALRHDTILYAKQSYTMMATSAGPMPKPELRVVGYVEPVPEFYNRLLALTRMTTKGLDGMDVLDEFSKHRLEKLEKILEKLVDLSKKELENKELTQEDYDFIEDFGGKLKGVIADVEEKAQKTTIIADVHTDGNSKQVLEEGIGYVDLIVVAYKVPDGRTLIGAGPVMTYYEFKQPMGDRLTDEKWRYILRTNPPEKVEWNSNFAVN